MLKEYYKYTQTTIEALITWIKVYFQREIKYFNYPKGSLEQTT
jgi:hypothetical protein